MLLLYEDMVRRSWAQRAPPGGPELDFDEDAGNSLIVKVGQDAERVGIVDLDIHGP